MLEKHESDARLAVKPEEAARLLGINRRTLDNWTRAGRIPATRIGRVVLYRIADLEALLRDNQKKGAGDGIDR